MYKNKTCDSKLPHVSAATKGTDKYDGAFCLLLNIGTVIMVTISE